LSGDRATGSDGFEPPKYLASLIAAINDGAKAAQSGGLLFLLIGVYLLATAFSASDEDLLRGRTVTISQIGATLPVSFPYAIAPFVFVFLHIYTLARYDMLAANVRQFLAELRRTVPLESDRDRCRQLLANVEFIQALVAPLGSRQYSPAWRWLVRTVVAIFPVFALLLVQINALRYQSGLINRVQQVGLALDLCALVWFFYRTPLEGSASQRESELPEPRRWAKVVWLPAIVMGLDLVYLNVVPAEMDARLVRYEGQPAEVRDLPLPRKILRYLADDNPLDVAFCPLLKWGCRYLRVDHRTVVDHVWDDKVMADLRRGGADQAKLAAIEGLMLRDRSLRFAMLDENSFYAADLIGADLRQSSLQAARLPGAKFLATQLQGAHLDDAQLQGANFDRAQLQGAHLSGAQLQGANLSDAQLQGANLSDAQLQGANLSFAQLQGANLFSAGLQGANLTEAQLQGADLSWAGLQGTNLHYARLQGGDLHNAKLEGANLLGVRLTGADLFNAGLWQASFGVGSDLGLSDLRESDFRTPVADNEIKGLLIALDAIPVRERKADAEKQLDRLLAPDQFADRPLFTASPELQILVSDPKNPVFARNPREWLIASPTPAYTSALVTLLADELASGDPAIAKGIATRVFVRIQNDERRSLYAPVACRLLANARAEKVNLAQGTIDELSGALRDAKITCEPATPH
jgi:uncharacterized protein YjbI with pentapeptide repeats